MIDSGLFGRCTAENLRLPGVKMTIEMNHRDCTVSTIDRPQKGKNNSMVSAEGDDTRVMFAIGRDGNKRCARYRVISERRERRAMEKLLVTVFNLFDGEFVVVRGDGDIATVDDLEAC